MSRHQGSFIAVQSEKLDPCCTTIFGLEFGVEQGLIGIFFAGRTTVNEDSVESYLCMVEHPKAKLAVNPHRALGASQYLPKAISTCVG